MADPTENVLSSWLVEYVCRTAWQQFSTTNDVDSRDLIQGAISLSSHRTQNQMSDVHFLILICRLADGKNYQLHYMDQNGDQIENVQTVLESVLPTFDKFVMPFVSDDRVKDSSIPHVTSNQAAQYRSLIKAQAVLTCCRENDFDTGQNVFNRQYKDRSPYTSFDKEWCSKLRNMLKSKNKSHRLITDNSYEKFLKKTVEFLRPFVETRDRPILIQLADAYNRSTKKINSAKNNKVFRSSTLMKAGVKIGEDISPSSPSLKSVRQKKAEELVKDTDRSQNNCSIAVHNLQTEDTETVEVCMKENSKSPARTPAKTPKKPIEQRIEEQEAKKRSLRKRSSSFVYRKNVNRVNRHLPVGSSTSSNDAVDTSSDEEETIPSKIPHKRMEAIRHRASLAPPDDGVHSKNANVSSTRRPPRGIRWDEEESIALYKAVQKFGVGRWARIKEDLGTSRTNVNLKDRWRTMLNLKIVDVFVERFGNYE